jgi:hypothetical protein
VEGPELVAAVRRVREASSEEEDSHVRYYTAPKEKTQLPL